MSSATVTVNFVASGANTIATASNTAKTAVTALGTASQTASNEVAQVGTKAQTASTGVSRLGSISNTLKSGMTSLRSGLVTVSGSMSTLIGTGVSLISNFHAIGDAQSDLTKSQNALTRNNILIEAAQNRVNKLYAEGKSGTAEYGIAVQKLNLLKSKEAPLAHNVEIAQRGVNEAYLNFVENLVPSLLTGVGGIVTLFGGLSKEAKPAETAVSALGTAFTKTSGALPGASSGMTGFGTALKGILLNPFTIALTAISLILVAIATNAFGFRDALNAVGVAIGNAIPGLRPLLDLIQALGAKFGLTGNDVKDADKQIKASLGSIGEQFNGLVKTVTPAINGFKEVVGKGFDFVVQGAKQFVGQLGSGDVVGALKTVFGGVVEAVKGIGTQFQSTFVDQLNPAIDAAISKLRTIAPEFVSLATDLKGFVTAFQLAFKGDFSAAVDVAIKTLGNFGTDLNAFITGPVTKFADDLGAGILKGITFFIQNAPGELAKAATALDTWFTSSVIPFANKLGKQLADGLGTLASQAPAALGTAFTVIAGLFTSNGQTAAAGWLAEIGKQFLLIPQKLREAFPETTKAASDLAAAIGVALNPLVQIIDANIIKPTVALFLGIAGQLTGLGTTIVTTIVTGWTAFANSVNTFLVAPILGMVSLLGSIGTDIVNVIVTGWSSFANSVNTFLVAPILGIVGLLGSIGTDIINKIVTGWTAFANLVNTNIAAPILNVPNLLGSIGQDIVNKIVAGWSHFVQLVQTNIITPIITIPNALGAVGQSIVNAIVKGWSHFGELVTANIVKPILNIPNAIGDIGKQISDKIMGGLGEVQKFFSGIGNFLGKQIAPPVQAKQGPGAPVIEAQNQAGDPAQITKAAQAAQAALLALAQTANQVFSQMITALGQVAQGFNLAFTRAISDATGQFTILQTNAATAFVNIITALTQITAAFGLAFAQGTAQATASLTALQANVATAFVNIITALTQVTSAFGLAFAQAVSEVTAQMTALETVIADAFVAIIAAVAQVAVAFTTAFNTAAQNAAGIINQLVTLVQTDMQTIIAATAAVAVAMTANFNKGAQNAAGSLNALTTNANGNFQSIITGTVKVATAMTQNFAQGANNAAGSMNALASNVSSNVNNMVSRLNSVISEFNNIRSSIQNAISAVQSLISSINNIPTSKTVNINVVEHITQVISTQFVGLSASVTGNAINRSQIPIPVGTGGVNAASILASSAPAFVSGAAGGTTRVVLTEPVVVNVDGRQLYKQINTRIITLDTGALA